MVNAMNKEAVALLCFDANGRGGVQGIMANMAWMLHGEYDVHLISVVHSRSYQYELPDDVHYQQLLDHRPQIRFTIIPAALRLRRYLHVHRIRILLVLGAWSGFAALLGGRGVTKVICDHGTLSAPTVSRYTRQEMRMAYHRFDRIVVLTQRARGILLARYPECADKVTVIPNGIAVPAAAPAVHPRPREVVTLSRLSEEKGLDKLLEVACKLRTAEPGFIWRLYGGGSLHDELTRRIAELGLQDNLIMMGQTADVQAAYRRGAVAVLTSPNEGFSLMLLEAKAAGLPLVAFDIDCSPSDLIRDGVDGFLIPKDDADAMAAALKRLLDDDALYQSMVAASRGNLAPFTTDHVKKEWLALLNGLTAKRGEPR